MGEHTAVRAFSTKGAMRSTERQIAFSQYRSAVTIQQSLRRGAF